MTTTSTASTVTSNYAPLREWLIAKDTELTQIVLTCLNSTDDSVIDRLDLLSASICVPTLSLEGYLILLKNDPFILTVIRDLIFFGEDGDDAEGNDLNWTSCMTNAIALTIFCVGYEKAELIADELAPGRSDDFDAQTIENLKNELNESTNQMFLLISSHPEKVGHCICIEQKGNLFRMHQAFKRIYRLKSSEFMDRSELILKLDHLAITTNPHADKAARVASGELLFGVPNFVFHPASVLRYAKFPIDAKTGAIHFQEAICKAIQLSIS